MSIAAISQSFVSAVRRSAASVNVEATEPVRALPRSSREGHGRRHELVAAMNQVLGVEPGTQDKAQSQAVFRFAHALMHDLRSMSSQPEGGRGEVPPGAGRGGEVLGRRDWGDLSQRLSTLSTAAAAPPATEAPAVPDMPDPVTTASAAVHIMKVPSARLLEAFVAMQRAFGRQDDALDPRHALARFTLKLAQAVTADGPIVALAGSLLDVKV
jgi:hypothetical protein